MTNVFSADKHASTASSRDSVILRAENDAEHAAKAAQAIVDAASLTGYTPSVGNVEDVGRNARAALSIIKTAAVVQETSNFIPLAIAFADYSALRLAITGAKVAEKEVKEFFQPIVKDFETSKKTISSYVTMARKAGMLMANYSTTTIRQAWVRIHDSALELNFDGDKPAGKGWFKDIVGDIAAIRPSEKSGKGDAAFFKARASAVLPLTSSDISDAYAKFIVGSPMTADGKVDSAKAAGKGADSVISAGLTEDMNVSGVNDADLLKAFVTMMKDKKRVEALLGSEANATDIYNAYMQLDMHVNEEGDVVLKKAA